MQPVCFEAENSFRVDAPAQLRAPGSPNIYSSEQQAA